MITIPESNDPDRIERGVSTIFLSDETFAFGPTSVADDRITGAQIAEAAGRRPAGDFFVAEHLDSGEIETKRPDELTSVADNRRHFFVIRSDGSNFSFFANDLSMEWPRASMTADQVVYLARAAADSEVVIHRGDGPAKIFEGDDEVRFDAQGVEKLITRPVTREINIKVDGENFNPPRRRMTPNEIIKDATKQEPSQVYLVRITGGDQRESYQGKGDTEIRLHDRMVFITISVGPTPVSEINVETGSTRAIKCLAALGYTARQLPGLTDHIAFDYVVQSGTHVGSKFRMGLVIPPDFPLSWPSGPHISPKIHPLNPGGNHPTGGIHETHSAPFQTVEKGLWQYWSRPYVQSKLMGDPMHAYMTHIWKLWDSQ